MKKKQKNITVIGTGSYGTALANVLADNNHNVIMYGIDIKQVNNINNEHLNYNFFGNLKINKKIKATMNFYEAVKNVEYIVLGIPVIAIKQIIEKINKIITKPIVIINTAKGLHPETNEILSKTITKLINPKILKSYAGIYGPSIAKEVLQKKPTCIMAVSQDFEIAKEIRNLFNNEYFIVFINTDIIGTEYAVSLKNSIAIASGIFSGIYKSDSTKASLITIGLNEIKFFSKIKGAKNETFFNFAGLADLILTTTSNKSRNYSFGNKIAKADNAQKILSKKQIKTIEGISTCKIIILDARNNNIYLPLFETLYEILYNKKQPSKIINNIFMKTILY